jgi:hypothetical protein
MSGVHANYTWPVSMEPRRLSERLIYCERACLAGFSNSFRWIERLFASNDRKILLNQPRPRYDCYSWTASSIVEKACHCFGCDRVICVIMTRCLPNHIYRPKEIKKITMTIRTYRQAETEMLPRRGERNFWMHFWCRRPSPLCPAF